MKRIVPFCVVLFLLSLIWLVVGVCADTATGTHHLWNGISVIPSIVSGAFLLFLLGYIIKVDQKKRDKAVCDIERAQLSTAFCSRVDSLTKNVDTMRADLHVYTSMSLRHQEELLGLVNQRIDDNCKALEKRLDLVLRAVNNKT